MIDAVKEELENLCNQNIIELVEDSEWLAQIAVVHKADNIIRLCVDLRALNKEVIVDRFPLPSISEMCTTLADAKRFSTLELASAYYKSASTRSLSRPHCLHYTHGCIQIQAYAL